MSYYIYIYIYIYIFYVTIISISKEDTSNIHTLHRSAFGGRGLLASQGSHVRVHTLGQSEGVCRIVPALQQRNDPPVSRPARSIHGCEQLLRHPRVVLWQ